MKRGLVLEGGGMRGLFSEGFIDVMQEEGITVDGMIGVSAGALFGCNFKSHQVGRGLRYNTRFKDDPRYMGWRSFLTTGNFVNAQFACGCGERHGGRLCDSGGFDSEQILVVVAA